MSVVSSSCDMIKSLADSSAGSAAITCVTTGEICCCAQRIWIVSTFNIYVNLQIVCDSHRIHAFENVMKKLWKSHVCRLTGSATAYAYQVMEFERCWKMLSCECASGDDEICGRTRLNRLIGACWGFVMKLWNSSSFSIFSSCGVWSKKKPWKTQIKLKTHKIK